MPKKGGLGQFVNYRGGLAKKEDGGGFKGELIPQCTLCSKSVWSLVNLFHLQVVNNNQTAMEILAINLLNFS